MKKGQTGTLNWGKNETSRVKIVDILIINQLGYQKMFLYIQVIEIVL